MLRVRQTTGAAPEEGGTRSLSDPSPNGETLRRRLLRLYLFGVLASFWFAVIVLRLWDFQVRQADDLSLRAIRQQEGEIDIPATRGGIYDRAGAELALSTPVQSIGVFPKKVIEPDVTAGLLAGILQVNESAL